MEVLGNCNARALRVRGYNSAEPEVISAVHCCATALLERISRPFADPRPHTSFRQLVVSIGEVAPT
jgi:hypothetical protein